MKRKRMKTSFTAGKEPGGMNNVRSSVEKFKKEVLR